MIATKIDLNKEAMKTFRFADELSAGNRYARNLILSRALRHDNPKSMDMLKVSVGDWYSRVLTIILFRTKVIQMRSLIPLSWNIMRISVKKQGLWKSLKNRFILPEHK